MKKRNKSLRAKTQLNPANVATTQDGFANIAARMGVRGDNLLGQGTYNFDLLTRNRLKLEAMYRGSWIVGSAVDSVAEDMTREGIEMSGQVDPEKIHQITSKMTRLGIWGSLLDAIKWSRLYGGAIAVLLVEGQDTATPLRIDTVGIGQFKGLRVYDRWQLQPDLENYVEDGADFGLPLFYTVYSNAQSKQFSDIKIHHSRVIRFIGIQLPYHQAVTEQMWGESIIERIYDRLLSFDTATSGAANLIQKAHLRTVQVNGLREILSAGGKAEENLLTMFAHMRSLQTNEGITLLDKEDSFSISSYTFAGLSDMILQFVQQVSGAIGVPLIRLYGQPPAGLGNTGENELRLYYDYIAAQQESRMREGVSKILRILHFSLYGKAAPEDFDFDFVPLWQTSQKEKSEIAVQVGNLIATIYEKGIIDHTTALREIKQSSDYTDVFSNITEEQISEAELTEPPMPVEAIPQELISELEPTPEEEIKVV